MSNQLAAIDKKEYEDFFTQKELEVVVNSIAKNATKEELALFIQICKHNGLDPFKNHIYFIKYGNQMSIQVSVEGIQYLAQQRDDYKGVTTQLVHENDEFEVEIDSETQELKITKHSIKFPRGKVAAAYAIARREGYPDKVIIIEADEVEHLRIKQGSQWKTYYNDMFKKHALKRALKLQFGIEVDDDQTQQDAYDPYEPRQRVDITPETKCVDTGDNVIKPDEELANVWAEIQKKTKELGVSKKDLNAFVLEKFEKKGKDLTLQETVALNKLIDFHFPKQEEKQDAEAMSFDDFEGITLD